jgi:hypothetical protein
MVKASRSSLRGAGIKCKVRKNFMRRGNLMLWIFLPRRHTKKKSSTKKDTKESKFKVDGKSCFLPLASCLLPYQLSIINYQLNFYICTFTP